MKSPPLYRVSWSEPSVSRCREEDGGSRPGTVAEGREVHVVTGAGADGAEQGAVHPAHDGAVQLARAAEAVPILVHRGHEDVLHLKVPARMEERQRVDEALGGAARDVKAHILGCAREEVLEMTLIEPRRQRRLRQVVEGDEALVEAHGLPDGLPEGRAAVPDHL